MTSDAEVNCKWKDFSDDINEIFRAPEVEIKSYG